MPEVICHPERQHVALGLCKQCYGKKYYERNREHLKEQRREWTFKNKYGLSVANVEELAKAQDFRCRICDRQFETVKDNLNVDHDHETGEVRGLLCDSCNGGLGLFKDSIDRLARAVAYLAEYKKVKGE